MFVYSSVLLLLLVVPPAILFLVWRARVRMKKLEEIGDAALVNKLSANVSVTRRAWKSALWVLTVVSLILALARPVWGVDAEIIEAEGVAVMVVLDISASMDAQDVLPSRLERAKLDLHDLFRAVEGNELGLVVYAGDAFLQFPLTSDVNSAITFLEGVTSASVTRQGTEIEAALRLALESFDERIAAHSIIVLASDGENQQGDPLFVAQEAAERGVTIHALGYGGRDGVPIPYRNAEGLVQYKADRAGNVVLSRLNEEVLQGVADLTGGLYQHMGETGEEVALLAERINAVEGGLLESRIADRPVERFGIFVALALLTLTCDILFPETRGKDG